jgi:hypothetical protein
LDTGLAKMQQELSRKGLTSSLFFPSALKLCRKIDKSGYMICYTSDERELAQMEEQIIHMCDSFKISTESMCDNEIAVKLQADKIKVTSINDVASIYALASIYRR